MLVGTRRYFKAAGYLLILGAVFYLVQTAIVSLRYYNRVNNWAVGSTGKLSVLDNADVSAAKTAAADYLRSLALGDYKTTYALTLPAIRPDYSEFADAQARLRDVYVSKVRVRGSGSPAPSGDCVLVMKVHPKTFQEAILGSQGERVNRQKLIDYRWPDRTLLLHESQTGVFWMILGKQGRQWKLISMSQTDPTMPRR